MDTDETNYIVSRLIRKSEKITNDDLIKIINNSKEQDQPIFGALVNKSNPYIIDLCNIVSLVTDMYIDNEGLVVVHKLLDTPSSMLIQDNKNSITIKKIEPVINSSNMKLLFINIYAPDESP